MGKYALVSPIAVQHLIDYVDPHAKSYFADDLMFSRRFKCYNDFCMMPEPFRVARRAYGTKVHKPGGRRSLNIVASISATVWQSNV